MISKQDIEKLAHIGELSDRLDYASGLTGGNIVEIGGGEGINTVRFLLKARDRKCAVIVVDPFEQIEGADESYFKPYSLEKFLRNVTGRSEYLADHLHLIKLPSQDPMAWLELGRCAPIGFVFIDGLQDRASVLSDLKLGELLEADIICVDDYDRLTDSSQVPLAVADFMNHTKYKFIDIGKREAYFIR